MTNFESGQRSIESMTVRQISLRILPFLILCYFINYIDRTNIGVAALTMQRDLSLSMAVYTWGASIFFIGYFIFEVPSNIFLHKVGARRWISRIMISWGLISAAIAFVTGPMSFYIFRFLLGIAEAGFFPGIILYLTYWFPQKYHARIISIFMIAIPLSSALGNPLSVALLDLDGIWGLQGWQWLFVIEGLPAAILGIVVLMVLPDRPERAVWLDAEQKSWLSETLARDESARHEVSPTTLMSALANPGVIILGIAYLGIAAATFGLNLWLPQIIKGLGYSVHQVGLIAAIPYVFGTIAMIIWGRNSDRVGERRLHASFAAFAAAVGLVLSGMASSPWLQLLGVSLAASGIYGFYAVFWAIPTARLGGVAAAGGIALINSIGTLGSFGGSFLVGWVKDLTGEFWPGLVALAAGPLVSAILICLLSFRADRQAEPIRGSSDVR